MNSFSFKPSLNDEGTLERLYSLQRNASFRESLVSSARKSISYKVQHIAGTHSTWIPYLIDSGQRVLSAHPEFAFTY